jgi:hypothetical protein
MGILLITYGYLTHTLKVAIFEFIFETNCRMINLQHKTEVSMCLSETPLHFHFVIVMILIVFLSNVIQ